MPPAFYCEVIAQNVGVASPGGTGALQPLDAKIFRRQWTQTKSEAAEGVVSRAAWLRVMATAVGTYGVGLASADRLPVWFESLLVHSGVSSATRRKATGADHKKIASSPWVRLAVWCGGHLGSLRGPSLWRGANFVLAVGWRCDAVAILDRYVVLRCGVVPLFAKCAARGCGVFATNHRQFLFFGALLEEHVEAVRRRHIWCTVEADLRQKARSIITCNAPFNERVELCLE